MKFDLHVHTNISSCSQLTLDSILCEAQNKGLHGVCITDHDTMAIREHVGEGIQENGLCVIFGMEYTTSEGDFLLFGPFEKLDTGLSAPELLRYVHSVDGVAVSAHPFRFNRPTQEHLIDQGLCFIVESINGRNHRHENDSVADWKHRFDIKEVGGSDAHSLEELGRVTTNFNNTITNRADFIQALKSGTYHPEPNQSCHLF
ncbi:MAG: PHP domain-containing protein [Desulfobulbaceae bacterium]|nr:PHP domain-containing protein [Desulfobulbaceae bacterium]